MKNQSVSSKHFMILLVLIAPFAFLFYQFFSAQSIRINLLEKQGMAVLQLQKKSQVIEKLIIQRLSSSTSLPDKQLLGEEIVKEVRQYEKIGLDSKLIFTNDLYGYYVSQMTLVQMPSIILDILKLSKSLDLAVATDKIIAQQLKEKLEIVSVHSARAFSLRPKAGSAGTRNVASMRPFFDRSFQFSDNGLMNKPSAVITEQFKEISKFWSISLTELGREIAQQKFRIESERTKFTVIVLLILLAALTCTMNIFFDMSKRIQKLTHLTKYTDPKQLSIQTGDFGYDEIGQLAHSFNTMALNLKDSFDRIEAANSAKSLFLANVSHEVRTPISGIIGMSKFLSESKLDSDQRSYINIIQKSSDMLLILVNDLLDLAKIESGKMSVENIPFSIDALLHDVYDCFKFQAAEKGVELKLVNSDQNFFVGDSFKIKQIIFNLVSNAIKFTDQGSVYLSCETEEKTLDRFRIKIKVKDQGIGIAENKLHMLFEDFVQVDASTTRKFGGTGLGLSLSKKLAKLMGGDLSVQSELGLGAEFTLAIELNSCAELATETDELVVEEETQYQTKPLKILVAEDNPVNQLIIKKYLQKWQFESFFVDSGSQAVEQTKHFHYDLVLMDCQMPGMDGFEATRLIKLSQPNLKIIALTANATAADQAKCQAAGMDHFISKPINPDRLFQLIRTSDSA